VVGLWPQKQARLDGERSRALAVLAQAPDGCTRAMMLGRGFPLALIASLIRAGLATDQTLEAQPQRS
jgi:hypothetical protein